MSFSFPTFPGQNIDPDERNKALTGKKPPKMNASLIRKCHREMNPEEDPRKVCVPVWSNTVSNKVYCSTVPIAKLKLIAISDMKINIPAKGCYLLLRTLERPLRLIGIVSRCVSTIVEDHTGDVFNFSAYNMVSEQETAEDIFPVGTVFALKEPFLKPSLDGGFMIRCDSPSDIYFTKRHQGITNVPLDIQWKNRVDGIDNRELSSRSALKWKELGNTYFRQRKYLLALEAYMSALNLCHAEVLGLTVRLNIAAVYLQLGYFEPTVEYCEMVLKKEPSNLKALYRSGRARYELRKFDEARKRFEDALKVDPGNSDVAVQLQRCRERLEEEGGNINISKLFLMSRQNPGTLLDCADYNSSLEVKVRRNGDKIAVATCDIQPGRLLVVSKAVGVAFKDKHLMSSYVNSNKTNVGGEHPKVVHQLTQLVLKNPETFGSLLYDLRINDAFLNSIQPKVYCDEENKEEPITDVERIRRIVTTNGISTLPYAVVTFEESNEADGAGLFIFPSHIKHSCIANVSWYAFNDVLVMHSTRHINAGDDIRMSQISPLSNFSSKEKLTALWETKCYCRLCELDRKEPETLLDKREGCFTEIMFYFNTIIKGEPVRRPMISQISELIQDIEESYRKVGRSEYRYFLILAYTVLAFMYSKTSPPSLKKTENLLMKAISAAGFCPESLVLDCSKGNLTVPKTAILDTLSLYPVQFLVAVYVQQKRNTEAKKWFKVLEMGEKILAGADLTMIECKYEHIPEEAFELLVK